MTRLPLALLVALALAGCAAPAANVATATPTPSVAAPTAEVPAGVPLTALGFTNAPATLTLPYGSTITQRTDAANNITAVISSPAGAKVLAHLRATLPTAGFTITADGGDSLLFTDGTWEGAFTISDGLSALTLRTDR